MMTFSQLDWFLQACCEHAIHRANIFSLATKNSGLVTKVATTFLFDLDLNEKIKVKTNIPSYLALLSS